MKKPAFDRLFERAIVMPNGCWEFDGFINDSGYGMISFQGKAWLSHRLAYHLCVNDIPEGLLVCHTCDNRPCVNPSHLFIGTIKDNNLDMVAKGRHGRKLMPEDLNKIRAMIHQGVFHRIIAEQFDVCREAITQIANRRMK